MSNSPLVVEKCFDDLLIAIVFYNGDERILTTIRTLSIKVNSILIINNKSEGAANSILAAARDNPSVNVIDNADNMGVGYALNQALNYAQKTKKKFLLTLDQDSIISIDCISTLLAAMVMGENDIVSVGPYYQKPQEKDQEVKYLITSGNLLRVDVALKVGGFDSNLFVDCVDLDFSFKLLFYGFRMKKVGGAFMQHEIGDLQYDSPIGVAYLGHGATRCFYNFRNNIYIYRKYFRHMPICCLKLFLSLLLKFMKIVLIEGNKKEKLKQSLYGIRCGFRMEIPDFQSE